MRARKWVDNKSQASCEQLPERRAVTLVKACCYLRKALAMATLCFSPPLSFRPRSPTMVSKPSGNRPMASVRRAISAALMISSLLADGLPYAMLLSSVSLNSTVSCGTTATAALRLACKKEMQVSCVHSLLSGPCSMQHGFQLKA